MFTCLQSSSLRIAGQAAVLNAARSKSVFVAQVPPTGQPANGQRDSGGGCQVLCLCYALSDGWCRALTAHVRHVYVTSYVSQQKRSTRTPASWLPRGRAEQPAEGSFTAATSR